MTMREEFEIAMAGEFDGIVNPYGLTTNRKEYSLVKTRLAWMTWQAATERAALICEERSGPLPGVGAYSALLAAADAIRGA